jgi:hypothetical protein
MSLLVPTIPQTALAAHWPVVIKWVIYTAGALSARLGVTNMDGWDLALLAAAAYMAATALVRLMLRRRDQMLEELRKQTRAAKRPAEPEEQEPPQKKSA